MSVVIIGANGQLGSELVSCCARLGVACRGLTHEDIAVDDSDSVVGALDRLYPSCPPTVVINTAAFHNLEMCERNPVRAWFVNSGGSMNVARWCSREKVKYCYVSTDYVDAAPRDASGLPLSVYAKTKLAGELAALSICPDALVVRVGTLYGKTGCRMKCGGNLIDTIVEKVKKQEPFTLPDYTSVFTTSAKRAAERILKNLDKSGVWYGTDPTGCTSHYKLGQRIAMYLRLPDKIMAVSKDPNDTLRPHTINGGGALLPWTDCPGLTIQDYRHEYLVEKGHINA